MNAWQSVLLEAADADLPLVLAWLAACYVLTRALTRGRAPAGRATRYVFALYLGLLPVAGLLRAHDQAAYGLMHGLVLLFGAEGCVLAAAALLFNGAGARLKVVIPHIVQEIAIAVAAAVMALAVAARVGLDLSGLMTTSAVLTAVIGFAMQDTLSNVTGGLFLQIDDSIAVGDRIRLGDISGKVVQIRWRHTAVETASGETAIIPNKVLLQSEVVVVGRRVSGPRHQRRTVYFNVDFRRAPTQVIDAVTDALVGRKIHNVAEEPLPSVILTDFGDSSARYAARYWLTDLSAEATTDSAVRSIIYFALKRAGIALAIPATADFVIERTDERRAEEQQLQAKARRDALDRADLFNCLSGEEREELAESLHAAPFARGEIMTRQGSEAHWLYLITKGTVSIRLGGADGVEKEIARLSAGEVFGEMSLLTGKPRATTVVAESEVRCFRLGKSAFASIIARRPDMAESFGEVLARRRSELVTAREGLDNEAAARALASDKKDLVSSIRNFFKLPPKA